jgi:hypothetical protein
MTDEEYYQEMEKKVEYYKKHYPDMYEKAEQWIKMLDHSEVYKNNSGDTSGENPEYYQAEDILKNMKFNGLEEEDVCTADIVLLNKHIPDWKEKVTQFLQGNE